MNNWRALSLLGRHKACQTQIDKYDCRQAQTNWLVNCLNRNAQCAYLQMADLGSHPSLASFRKKMPLVDYDVLRPWIEKVTAGESDLLFAGAAVACESTGGSTGGAKLIPYSEHSLADFRRALIPWMTDIVDHYQIDSGYAYWAISPAIRSIPNPAPEVPYGLSDADYLGPDVVPIFMRLSAVNLDVATSKTLHQWQLLTLLDLLCHPDLALVSVWSPTFFLSLLDVIPQHASRLFKLFSNGGWIGNRVIVPNLAATNRLAAYLASKDTSVLWPQLKLISCWADGSSQLYYEELRRCFPTTAFQPKGLLATEAVITTPDVKSGLSLLAMHSGFFEFLDDAGNILLAHEIESGRRYQVIVTTAGGLYRYRTGDLVICTGHGALGQPGLRFLGRGNLVSDMVGEKLTDAFVQRVLADALADVAGTIKFSVLIPDMAARRYVVVCDTTTCVVANSADTQIAGLIEARLLRNPQYAYARAAGQLRPLEVRHVHRAQQIYIAKMLAEGRRLGDIKMPNLLTSPEWLALFTETTQQ